MLIVQKMAKKTPAVLKDKWDPMEIKNIKVLATVFEGDFNIVKSNNLKRAKGK